MKPFKIKVSSRAVNRFTWFHFRGAPLKLSKFEQTAKLLGGQTDKPFIIKFKTARQAKQAFFVISHICAYVEGSLNKPLSDSGIFYLGKEQTS